MSRAMTEPRSTPVWLIGLVALSITAAASLGGAQQMPSTTTAELAPTGRLRVGINFGNALLAVKDARNCRAA
jgi:hypothetical protein